MAEELDDPFAEEVAPAPPKKKSLFTKSLWNKPVRPMEQKEGIDFFSRAEEMWPSRVAEEERKRHKKLEKLERKRSTDSAERKRSTSPDSKRRLVSKVSQHHSSEGSSINHDDPDEASWRRRESALSTPGSRKSHSSPRQKLHASPTSLAERYSINLPATSKESGDVATKGYISLSDGGTEAGFRGPSNSARQPILLDEGDGDVLLGTPNLIRLEEDPDISDEEFPELAQEAREREQRRVLERLKAGRPFENKNYNTNGSNTPDYAVDDIFQQRPSDSEDHMVEIFVSSVIEGTNPLIVRRKLSQKLREVRLIWCDKQSISGQPFSKSIKDSIFLTWRGKRLFDFTTCNSLGLKMDGIGQLNSDGKGVIDGKVHLEAWTEDLFDHNQRKLASSKNRGGSDDEPEEKEAPVEEIRVTLIAKGKKELKLKVRTTTSIQKFMNVFRQKEEIPVEKVITLRFDDEELDPESTVGDTGIEDRDVIEVHIR